MPNLREAYSSALKRVNPEGLAISTTLSYVSLGVIVPMEAGITYVIHEAAKTNPSIVNLGVVAAVGLTNAASIAIETRTFKRKNYGASPVGSALNVATGKPLVSSIGEHVFNNAQFALFNPINAVALANNDPVLIFESMAATSIALGAWHGPVNSIILAGKIDPVVNRIRSIRKAVWGRIKR